MYNERMQILISPEQRRRIEDEAASRNVPLAVVVRGALDEHLGSGDGTKRERAAARILSRDLRSVSPKKLNDMLDERHV